jgi:hypothetical protein
VIYPRVVSVMPRLLPLVPSTSYVACPKIYVFRLESYSDQQQINIVGYRCEEPGCKYQTKSYRPDLFKRHAQKHENEI